jgi:hypothetical protein
MRIVFFLLAVAAAGYAGYLQFYHPSNYTSFSEAKLTQLDQAYDAAISASRGEAERDANRLSQMLVQNELTRRLHVKAALGGAAVFLVLGLVMTLLRGRGGSREEQEQARVSSPTARDASGAPTMTREQAAALLGVQPNAPRAVVEAALQAQLAERDPSQLVGLDPTLKHNVLQQREELRQAGNVLLGRQELAITDPSQE